MSRLSDLTTARIAIPQSIRAGDVIEIKTLITHPMESGFRLDSMGKPIARNILTAFECLFDNERVFHAELKPGIAANPYLSFHARVDHSGTFRFIWTEQTGATFEESRDVQVA